MARQRVAPSERRWFAKLLIGMGWGVLFGGIYTLLFFVTGAALESGARGATEAIFIGVLLALVIGGPLGAGMGLASMGLMLLTLERQRPPSRSRRWWTGVAIGGGVALLVPIVLVAQELGSAQGSPDWGDLLRAYVAWYGLASLLFVLGCGLIAVRYYAPANRASLGPSVGP